MYAQDVMTAVTIALYKCVLNEKISDITEHHRTPADPLCSLAMRILTPLDTSEYAQTSATA